MSLNVLTISTIIRKTIFYPRDLYLSYYSTAFGKLVGVITNRKAVRVLLPHRLLARKLVMEGKNVLFKQFADHDVFDNEISTTDPVEFIRTVNSLKSV